ncbi:MAG TPA: 2-amino-4-hydroxy-6-hydroxymethyldihydropteridine diphosphokinase [Allosphingosinicella sp.]|nr:2-amino-4-hydroxy-6-hydroxymethyldihydropteridine diphosphokinase [Allosphingosinicella sp.]
MAKTSYAVALGSNRRHGVYGAPAAVVRAAGAALAAEPGVALETLSTIRATPALGPAGRSFANAAAILSSSHDPAQMLVRLKAIERAFGRRPGRRWGPRVLDLDIVLWSHGPFAEASLTIPHPAFRARRFVLDPLAELVPGWRDPLTGLTIRQLHARLAAPRPVDPAPQHS